MEVELLNKQKGNTHLYQNKDWIYDQYVNKKISMAELAKLANCSYVTLWTWMKKFGIQRRLQGQNPKRIYNHINLNCDQLDFLIGLLLGDGSLEKSRFSNISAYNHGDKRLNYIIWLRGMFQNMGFQCGNIYPIQDRGFKFKTSFYVELHNLYKRFYPNGIKILPVDLKISPNILKNWYIGDGNNSKSPLIDSSMFDVDAIKSFIEPLNQFGIIYSLRSFKSRVRIRISSKTIHEFFKYILSDDPIIPPGYKYKFKEKHHASQSC